MTFRENNILWFVDEIIPEENKYFTWDKIIYSWSGFGEMPIFASEKRITYKNRKPK